MKANVLWISENRAIDEEDLNEVLKVQSQIPSYYTYPSGLERELIILKTVILITEFLLY